MKCRIRPHFWHVSENSISSDLVVCFGVVFCVSVALRALSRPIRLYKWLVELVSKSNSTFRTRFREWAGKVWQRAGWKNRANLVIENWCFCGFLEFCQFAQIENSICKYCKSRRTPQIKREHSVSLKKLKIKFRTRLHFWHMSENFDFEWSGGMFWCDFLRLRCAARTVDHQGDYASDS